MELGKLGLKQWQSSFVHLEASSKEEMEAIARNVYGFLREEDDYVDSLCKSGFIVVSAGKVRSRENHISPDFVIMDRYDMRLFVL